MNNNQPKTKLLNKPLTMFKKPNMRDKASVPSLSQIEFVLPSGHVMTANLDNKIVLGRDRDTLDSAIKVDFGSLVGAESGISRIHAVIQVRDNTVYVSDYKSLNGTFLNKAELYPMRNYALKEGDSLSLGKIRLEIKFVYKKEVENEAPTVP